jgi:hypothetical protein
LVKPDFHLIFPGFIVFLHKPPGSQRFLKYQRAYSSKDEALADLTLPIPGFPRKIASELVERGRVVRLFCIPFSFNNVIDNVIGNVIANQILT